MHIGITGGAGFIGSRLTRELIARGYAVSVMDNLHQQVHAEGHPPELAKPATLFVGDVEKPDDWDAWFAKQGLPDVLVHLAAETGTGQSLTQASRHGRVNVVGTTEMLDALSRSGQRPEHLLVASSRAVYGEGVWLDSNGTRHYAPPRSMQQLESGDWNPHGPDGPLDRAIAHAADSIDARPTNIYAATKLAQEHVMAAWCGAFETPLSVLRLQNVYGPGQAVGNPYTGVLTFFASEIARDHQLDVYEDGQIIRDFVHVGDVVDAFVRSIENPPQRLRRLDIGSGRGTPLVETAKIMSAGNQVDSPHISGRFRAGDVRCAFADISAASEEISWSPKVPIEQGLADLVRWVADELKRSHG